MVCGEMSEKITSTISTAWHLPTKSDGMWKFPGLFPLGSPTEGVKPPAEPTADWKGLTRLDEIRLTAPAQTLRARPGHGTNQGLRNHALLAVLLGSGLRVSEALSLDRAQYTRKGFDRVQV